jgi:hypothetical protein
VKCPVNYAVPRAWRVSSSCPGNLPTGERRKPVDGGRVVSGRLRIGESSGARLAGQLGLDEGKRLFD